VSRIVSLALGEYGSGRMAFIPGRINAVCTGGEAVGPIFRRRLFEWLSSSSATDNISVAAMDISEGVDSVDSGLHEDDRVSVERISSDRLGVPSSLSRYDCLVIEGAGNHNISPISKSTLLSFISSGKGVLYLDFSTVHTVTAVPPGFYIGVSSINFEVGGQNVWTDDGKASGVYSESVSGIDIPLVGLVYDDYVSSLWTIAAVRDPSSVNTQGNEEQADDAVYSEASSFSFPGQFFIARFSTVYEKGVIDVQK
jgi:hypothetical protein